jgi:general secretion pathway protein C
MVNTLQQFGESMKGLAVQQRASEVCTVMLFMLSAWVLGQMIWQPWSVASLTSWQPSSSLSTATIGPDKVDITQLLNSNLFGKYQADAPVVEKPKVQDAPKSRLNVVLVGIVTSSERNKSLAVIANRGKQATYGIGEAIAGTRAKLVQVHADRVIIDNSGRDETVMLEGIKYSKSVETNERHSRTKESGQKVSSDGLAKIRDEIRRDAKQIFQYVRMSQVKKDGAVIGYRLSPGKDKALFDSVGLRAGDIAIAINGQALQDPAAMGEVFRSLSQLTELTLTVERDGQPFEIYIEL